ncbi:hypothetical protein [Sphaerimonospora mesophila]|uniref:hypothetical protein n=1 Tax=Sphaerimonospora mesophila TaxID=37483 RepID=UPI0006E14623
MTTGAEGEGLRDADPRQIDPHRILGRLGQGGMGTVFLGRDAEDREAAVKVIHPHWAADPDFQRRFQREVAAAQRCGGSSTRPSRRTPPGMSDDRCDRGTAGPKDPLYGIVTPGGVPGGRISPSSAPRTRFRRSKPIFRVSH